MAHGPRPRPARDPSEALARWLYAETGGHPLFITETVKSLFEQGLLQSDATGGWLIRPGTADGNDVGPRGFIAPGVQQVVRARIARLSRPARSLLTAGAALGDGFDFARLCRVAGVSESASLPALDELLDRRLLRETGARYRFGHDKIREVAYAEAGEARRRIYHRRALECLEPMLVPAAELARHALAAGLLERAFDLSVAAGDAAMRLYAVRDAIVHYEQARKLTLELRRGQRPAGDLQALFSQLGRAYELATRFAEARAIYEEMLNFAREQHDPKVECAALNRLATMAAHDPLDFGAQASLLQEALTVAQTHDDTAGLAETEWNLARLSFFRSNFAAAHAHAARALALAGALGLKEPIARGLNWMSLVEVSWGKLTDAQRHGEEARALYAELGDRAMEADSLSHLAGALNRSGQPSAGIAAARAGRAISLEIDNAWGQAATAMELTVGLLDCGEYEEALETAQAGVDAARLAGYPPLLILNLTLLGSAYRHLGALETARSVHQEAWSVAGQVQYPLFSEAVASELCADHALAGDWSGACDYAREALVMRNYETIFLGFARWYETEALLRAGAAEQAAEDLRRFGKELSDRKRYRLPYLRALAVLAQWHGNARQAIDHLEGAKALAEEISLPGDLWQIDVKLADLHRARGDEEQACRYAAQAAEVVDLLANRIPDAGPRESFLSTVPSEVLALTRGAQDATAERTCSP